MANLTKDERIVLDVIGAYGIASPEDISKYASLEGTPISVAKAQKAFSDLRDKGPLGKKDFTTEEAREIGNSLNVDWGKIDLEEFRKGLGIELEHGTVNPRTNLTNDDPIATGKVTLAHLGGSGEPSPCPNYNTRLIKMEDECRGKFV